MSVQRQRIVREDVELSIPVRGMCAADLAEMGRELEKMLGERANDADAVAFEIRNGGLNAWLVARVAGVARPVPEEPEPVAEPLQEEGDVPLADLVRRSLSPGAPLLYANPVSMDLILGRLMRVARPHDLSVDALTSFDVRTEPAPFDEDYQRMSSQGVQITGDETVTPGRLRVGGDREFVVDGQADVAHPVDKVMYQPQPRFAPASPERFEVAVRDVVGYASREEPILVHPDVAHEMMRRIRDALGLDQLRGPLAPLVDGQRVPGARVPMLADSNVVPPQDRLRVRGADFLLFEGEPFARPIPATPARQITVRPQSPAPDAPDALPGNDSRE